jgi:hypothetical protein
VSRDNDELMPSSPLSSSLSLHQDESHTSSLRRSLRKQIGDCKGSKFQIVIHFDAHPEDFSMQLLNDDKNKTVWALDDPNRTYADPKYQHATVATGVCLPREWCWVLTVYDKTGEGYVRLRCVWHRGVRVCAIARESFQILEVIVSNLFLWTDSCDL